VSRALLPGLAAGILVLASACGSSEPEAEPPAAEPTTVTGAATTTEPPPTTSEEATTEDATTEAAPSPPPPPKAPPGAPAFVAGYRGWTKLNAQPIPPRDSDPHNGTKNVYASKPARADGRFPNGTIVVKEATRPGADFVGLLAVMRKRAGADPEHNDWVFVEYTRDARSERFAEIGRGAVCWGCHVGAQDTDYVFTAGG
jgi:Cytochrome P460